VRTKIGGGAGEGGRWNDGEMLKKRRNDSHIGTKKHRNPHITFQLPQHITVSYQVRENIKKQATIPSDETRNLAHTHAHAHTSINNQPTTQNERKNAHTSKRASHALDRMLANDRLPARNASHKFATVGCFLLFYDAFSLGRRDIESDRQMVGKMDGWIGRVTKR
jgi:hypothetical protein